MIVLQTGGAASLPMAMLWPGADGQRAAAFRPKESRRASEVRCGRVAERLAYYTHSPAESAPGGVGARELSTRTGDSPVAPWPCFL